MPHSTIFDNFVPSKQAYMKKGLFALASGTFVLGITEYVMMAILADVALNLHITIPQAGHLISAYAIGVSVGAPLLVFAHHFRPKHILMFLSLLMLIGSTLTVCAPNYLVFLLARFISGLPHGAFFGTASIVAVRLADPKRQASAVSMMIAGMTVANLLGVPLASSFGHLLSWQFPFFITICCSLLVMLFIWLWIPNIDKVHSEGFKGQFRFLKHLNPWLTLGATLFSNAGIFCWYSYIAPFLIEDSGFHASTIPLLMFIAGVGMIMGNFLSGRLADRFSAEKTSMYIQLTATLALVFIVFLASIQWASVFLMFITAGALFAVSGPQQFLILKHAKGGEMLGGAMIQMAFNLGNAIGAFCGGIPIALHYAPRYTAVLGVPLCLVSFLALQQLYRRSQQR